MNPRTPFRYLRATLRLDLLVLPAALWALFVLVMLMQQEYSETAFNISRSYLGGVLPLTGGFLAAYAVLDDPTLELQFATPRPAWAMLLERLGMVGLVLAVSALAFQGAAPLARVDLSPLGSWPLRQLAWIMPSLAMIGLGSAAGFAAAQSVAGGLVAGGLWFFQVIFRDALADHPVARYIYLFMGATSPDFPWLRSNQASLLLLSVLLLWASVRMLKKQERFI